MTKLSKYPEGSLKELLYISIPLMLSVLSGNLMMFFDRLILAKYSLAAMNAATTAGLVCIVFQIGAIGIASIAEVFVGQYNGSKQYTRCAAPTWQMIYLSIALMPVFFFVAHYLPQYLLPEYHYQNHGLPYFTWILYFSALFPIQAAISAFFIGIGKVRLVSIATIIGNIFNIILDYLLVFGVPHLVPEMGTKGAAIATGLAQAIQILILLFPFLSKSIKEKYNSNDYSFDFKLLKNCVKTGAPSAAGHMIEISAWACVAQMMAMASENHLTVISIGQSLYALIAFAMEGLQKGVTAVSSNLIGANKWTLIYKSWRSSLKMLTLFALVFGFVLIFYPDFIIDQFLSEVASKYQYDQLLGFLKIVAISVWVYFILDSITWIAAGILTAMGDTVFVMLMNAFAAWTFALMPIYYFIVMKKGSPELSWVLINIYATLNATLFSARAYLKLKRKENKVSI